MRPLSSGWSKCRYLDVSWVLHACRAQSLASPQGSNAFPSLACTVWNIRHASMQKKDTVALLHHADKPSGKLVVGKPNTLRLLIPALTLHSQIKEMRHFLPASVGSRKPSFPNLSQQGSLNFTKTRSPARRVTREGAGREFETGNRTGDTRKNLM